MRTLFKAVVLALVVLACSASRTLAGDDDAALLRSLARHGIAPIPDPPEYPGEVLALGRMLFYDKVLSGPRNTSCATCHHPSQGLGDGLPTSRGRGGTGRGLERRGGLVLTRNAPALFNLWLPSIKTLFWDGHTSYVESLKGYRTLSNTGPYASTEFRSALEAQVVSPLISNYEMRGNTQDPGNEVAKNCTGRPASCMDLLLARLMKLEGYRELFAKAYPDVAGPADYTHFHLTHAIAAFETVAFTSRGSPFDEFLAGKDDALTAPQKRGLAVFLGAGKCAECHNGPLLSDFGFHGVAVPQIGPGVRMAGVEPFDDRGRFEATGIPADVYRFRTPPLRNVARTGPWMHDGAFSDLSRALRHHLSPATEIRRYQPRLTQARRYEPVPRKVSARILAISPLLNPPIELSAAQVEDLLAFLTGGLTDPKTVAAWAGPPKHVPSGLPVED